MATYSNDKLSHEIELVESVNLFTLQKAVLSQWE